MSQRLVNALAKWLILPARRPGTRLAPVAAWAAFLFILSAIPGSRYPDVNVPMADKAVHALLYVPLGWLFARSFDGGAEWLSPLLASLLGFLAGAAYGASDEFHQLFVPMRSCSVADWVVDCCAVAIGTGGWLFASPRMARSDCP